MSLRKTAVWVLAGLALIAIVPCHGSQAEVDILNNDVPSGEWAHEFKKVLRELQNKANENDEECEDLQDECDTWEKAGECKTNPSYMNVNCKRACGICGCKDKSPNCEYWKNVGECETNPNFMEKRCPVSCGICDPTGRNIAGRPADITDAPFSGTFSVIEAATANLKCTVVMVDLYTALTSAACIFPYRSAVTGYVLFGTADRSSSFTETTQIRTVTEFSIVFHPDFNITDPYDYDMAVIKTNRPFEESDTVSPIELGRGRTLLYPGRRCSTFGWGAKAEGESQSNILQTTKVSLQAKPLCRAKWFFRAIKERFSYRDLSINEREMCVQPTNEASSQCDFDGGSPIVCGGKLMGLLSWGRDVCANGASPDDLSLPWVTSKVSAYSGFINSLLGEPQEEAEEA